MGSNPPQTFHSDSIPLSLRCLSRIHLHHRLLGGSGGQGADGGAESQGDSNRTSGNFYPQPAGGAREDPAGGSA